MQTSFDRAFDRLLSSWRRHEQLRADQASFSDRLDSASQLKDARIEMARVRNVL